MNDEADLHLRNNISRLQDVGVGEGGVAQQILGRSKLKRLIIETRWRVIIVLLLRTNNAMIKRL